MLDMKSYGVALVAMFCLAILGWQHSYRRHNVTVVDSLWSVFFLLGLLTYAVMSGDLLRTPRAAIVMALVTLWSLRLTIYLSGRNHGKPEDHRYAQIRQRNEPGFAVKSLYLVFGLQAVLAWVIAIPLALAYSGHSPLGIIDGLGIALWLVGFAFEVVGDAQLARFKSDPANAGKVMDRGLWRFTRHPNYFGEACLWWAYWMLAVAAGGAWSVFSPLLMTLLLLKVSGVALLERDIVDRRPAYRDYIKRTNAFIPGPPREKAPL